MARPQTDFSKGSVKKLVLSQALPLTMAQAVQLLYNIVDRIYIGHLEGIGDLALTGLGITFPVIVIIAAFTSLYGTGGATLFSLCCLARLSADFAKRPLSPAKDRTVAYLAGCLFYFGLILLTLPLRG